MGYLDEQLKALGVSTPDSQYKEQEVARNYSDRKPQSYTLPADIATYDKIGYDVHDPARSAQLRDESQGYLEVAAKVLSIDPSETSQSWLIVVGGLAVLPLGFFLFMRNRKSK